jgi:S1-C subfamily serine protease
MAVDVAALVDEIREAAATYNHSTLDGFCADFREAIYARGVEPGQAKVVLRSLRSMRAFNLMRSVADAFLTSGGSEPQVVRQYAQALIDSGDLMAAKAILDSLVARLDVGEDEYAEAMGLLGRSYKQMYIERAKTGAPADGLAFTRAVAAYSGVYNADPTKTWHGVNAAALLARGIRDGVSPVAKQQVESLAETIASQVKGLWEEGTARAWDMATAMEAHVALADNDAAMTWLARYVQEPDVDAFAMASTARQLQEIWQVAPDSDMYGLLEVLQARILEREGGGRIQLAAGILPPAEETPKGLEKTFGTVGAFSVEWLRMLVSHHHSVARIEHEDSEPVGTAWVVRGGDIIESFGDELMLLTNSHVVSQSPVLSETLFPEDAWANFTSLEGGVRFKVDSVVFESPQRELDASLMKMQALPAGVPPLKLSKRLPLADGEQRVYVVGHPKGGDVKISIDDNILLDHDGTKLHYRAPTEPGSSGSPVFNKKLRVIALHHAGRDDMPKLNNKPGKYEANEGISLEQISRAASKELG